MFFADNLKDIDHCFFSRLGGNSGTRSSTLPSKSIRNHWPKFERRTEGSRSITDIVTLPPNERLTFASLTLGIFLIRVEIAWVSISSKGLDFEISTGQTDYMIGVAFFKYSYYDIEVLGT